MTALLAPLHDLVFTSAPPGVAEEEIDAQPTDHSRESFEPTGYFARAIPAREGGFTGQYGAPGLLPSRIKDHQECIAIFRSEADAELAAARALISVLTSRGRTLRQGKPERYRKMTGEEFAEAMADAGITPTFLAYLVGTSPARVLKWLEDPEEDVPHQVRLLLALFTHDPALMDLAEEVTRAVTTERSPRQQ